MLTGNFQQLHSAVCIQTGADVESDVGGAILEFGGMFNLLMAATRNNPCDGCPAYNGGTCEAYKRFNTLARPQERATRMVFAAKRCPECGLRIRGENHAEGDDHKRKSRAVFA